MKQMVCEMCGGTDLVKENGVFVCQSCGTKYSVEEARKMLTDSDEVVKVKVDDTEKIGNYISMAKSALDNANNTEAEQYCNKILETDPTNYEAWLLKGQAAGWQSTLARLRIDEAISCIEKAIKYVPFDKLEEVAEEAQNVLQSLLYAVGSLKLDSLVNYPSIDSVKEFHSLRADLVMKALSVQIAYGGRIKAENEGKAEDEKITPTSFECFLYNDRLDKDIFTSSIKIWNAMIASYNKEAYPSDYIFEDCKKDGTVAMSLMNFIIPKDASKIEDKKKENVIKYALELIKMKDTYQNLKSYRSNFSGGVETHLVDSQFTPSYKQTLCNEIEELRNIILTLDPERDIPKTSSEIERERLDAIAAKKAAKKANRNKPIYYWLFGLVVIVVVNFIRGRLLRHLGLDRMGYLTISAILFVAISVAVAYFGYLKIAERKKKISMIRTIYIAGVFGGCCYYMFYFLYIPLAFAWIQTVINLAAAALVMFCADNTGELINTPDEKQAESEEK